MLIVVTSKMFCVFRLNWHKYTRKRNKSEAFFENLFEYFLLWVYNDRLLLYLVEALHLIPAPTALESLVLLVTILIIIIIL